MQSIRYSMVAVLIFAVLLSLFVLLYMQCNKNPHHDVMTSAISSPVARVDFYSVPVFSGPGASCDTIGFLFEGLTLPVSARSVDSVWLEVVLPDSSVCWIAVASVDLSVPLDSIVVAVDVTSCYVPDAVVSVQGLNVRSGPSIFCEKTRMLHEGDTLSITGRDKTGGWLKVTPSEWVSSKYLTLNVPLETIDLAPVIPSCKDPVDVELAEIEKKPHGTLSQPPRFGNVAADGQAEITLINDTPYGLTVLVGQPYSDSFSIDACEVCKVYWYTKSDDLTEADKSKPHKTLRIYPGFYQVAVKVDDSSIQPFYGEWELKADVHYMSLFYIVRMR